MAVTTDGLVREYIGAYAAGGTDPGNNAGPTSVWKDLTGGSDITITRCAYSATSPTYPDGWAGDGSSGDPYCLCRDGFGTSNGTYAAMGAQPACLAAGGSTWTVELWFKSAVGAAGNLTFVWCRSGVTGMAVFQSGGANTIEARVGDGAAEAYPNAGGDCTSWQHLTFVSTGTTVAAYLGHTISATGNLGCVYSGYSVAPEIFPSAVAAHSWGARLATLRIYSKALSHAEIDANDAAGILGVGTSVGAPAFTGLTVTKLLNG
jgi:hypothetical protein